MELKRKETIGWIDLLRVIACFLVVFATLLWRALIQTAALSCKGVLREAQCEAAYLCSSWWPEFCFFPSAAAWTSSTGNASGALCHPSFSGRSCYRCCTSYTWTILPPLTTPPSTCPPSRGKWQWRRFAPLSLIENFWSFTTGLFPITQTIRLLSITVMFIILTIIVMKRRKLVK